MKEGLEQKIKSVGYWRVNIRPSQPLQEKLSLQFCSDVVEKSRVSLRGWDYPHFSRNDEHGGHARVGEYVESWCDWYQHVEFWRMYRSSQFLHYKGLREDLSEDLPNKPAGRALSVASAIYSLTEIVEFASRLRRHGLYSEGAKILIILGNTDGRQLWISDSSRMPFFEPRQTQAQEITIERTLTSENLEEAPLDSSLGMILELFDHFGWNPDSSLVRTDQTRFYEKVF